MEDLHARSHGESFLDFIQRADQPGLYIMDEPDACYQCAFYYAHGWGTPRDLDKALTWAKRAKERRAQNAEKILDEIQKSAAILKSLMSRPNDSLTREERYLKGMELFRSEQYPEALELFEDVCHYIGMNKRQNGENRWFSFSALPCTLTVRERTPIGPLPKPIFKRWQSRPKIKIISKKPRKLYGNIIKQFFWRIFWYFPCLSYREHIKIRAFQELHKTAINKEQGTMCLAPKR